MEFNLAQVHEAVEAAVPERECIVVGDRRLTYRQVGGRTRALANALRGAGLGRVVPRRELAPHLSGQDHLALYLHNGSEYLEAMLGAYKARVAPFNVNYRYVAEELEYLLADAAAAGIVFHSTFAPTLTEVLPRVGAPAVLWQVPDDSGNPLVEGAEWFEDVIAASSDELPRELVDSWSPDDLYLLYTGGTTGMPRAVMWRQADIFVGALGGRRLDTGEEWASLSGIAANAANGGARLLPGPPFMHGAAHWMALNALTNANTVVLPRTGDRWDPAEVAALIEHERVEILLIVGDAFGRPLVEELERTPHDVSSLLVIVSGGAVLSPGIARRLLAAAPSAMVLDGLGASETGQQASHLMSAGRPASTGSFTPLSGMCVLSADRSRVLAPGEDEVGWLAQSGRIPLGYLGDADATASTFPTVGGRRVAIPGDRARLAADGSVELLGRESVTINSGGEKIFAEEVERALLHHPSVADCVVAGRPSPRWGEEVVALVQLIEGAGATDEDLIEEAGRHVARFKLPKELLRVDAVVRSPSGKADYRWARSTVSEGRRHRPALDSGPR